MRRVPAMLLLALFSFSLIGPALLVEADSNLPACCRRDGKHHCAMMAMDEATSSGLAIGAVTSKCPCFPKGGAVPPASGAALAPTHAACVSMVGQPAAPPQVLAGEGFCFGRSHLKRGPPRLFS